MSVTRTSGKQSSNALRAPSAVVSQRMVKPTDFSSSSSELARSSSSSRSTSLLGGFANAILKSTDARSCGCGQLVAGWDLYLQQLRVRARHGLFSLRTVGPRHADGPIFAVDRDAQEPRVAAHLAVLHERACD